MDSSQCFGKCPSLLIDLKFGKGQKRFQSLRKVFATWLVSNSERKHTPPNQISNLPTTHYQIIDLNQPRSWLIRPCLAHIAKSRLTKSKLLPHVQNRLRRTDYILRTPRRANTRNHMPTYQKTGVKLFFLALEHAATQSTHSVCNRH